MEQDPRDLYTARQVASICKVTLRRVHKWLNDGDVTGAYTSDGQTSITRESLRIYMVAKAMDLTRLPQAAEVTAAKRAADARAAIISPEVQVLLRRVAALEAYVRELRTKLFYRDIHKVADRFRVTDQERDAIEIENTAAKRRWDVDTDKLLAAIAGMK